MSVGRNRLRAGSFTTRDSTGHARLDTTLAPHALPTAEGAPVSPSLVALLSSISCVLESSLTPKQLPVLGM